MIEQQADSKTANRDGKDNEANTSDAPSEIIAQNNPPSRDTCAEKSSNETGDSEHRENERALVRWTRVVAFLTGGLIAVGAITGYIFFLQLSEMKTTSLLMKGQLDVMQAQESDQRAWVSFTDPQILSDLTIEGGAKILTFGATVQNTGHVPAENVTAYLHSYVSGTGIEKRLPNEVRDSFCGQTAKYPLVRKPIGNLRLDGYVLFPGDKMPFQERITISPADIAFLRSTPTQGANVWVIVCINYKIILQKDDRHQTSHMFVIHGPRMSDIIPLESNDTIPQNKLGVSWQQYFGTTAN